ncbi:MAG TPA: peptidase C14 caspase catalytic subunit p20 [Deltaproteobacteria bacterium]|nr:peptidase C14 caspase catalytic subunit p20 [Deltaproteobacteria bacterium]
MEILKKIFGPEDSHKDVNAILARGKSLLEKNFYEWATVEFNKALALNPKLAAETVTKLFQEMQGSGNPDGTISLGTIALKMDPKNVDLANQLGNTYRKKQDWNHAKNMYLHCLKYDPDYKNAVYNLAATTAKVEVADGMAISAIDEFEKMTDFVLPDIEEGMGILVEMQINFAVDTVEVNQEQSPDENNETKVMPEKEAKEDNYIKIKTDTDTDTNDKDDLDSIDAVQTFKYITSNLEAESLQEKEAIFTLGIYCLKNNETKIAQYSLKRLLMRDKENVDLRCFLVLAISIDGKINEAIKSFQSILGRNPNHRYTNVNMGILLKRKGMIQQSRVRFFTTFRLLEQSKGNYDMKACLENADKLFNNNQKKKALEIYEPLISEITSEVLLHRIAKLYLDKKLLDGALEVYKRILRKNRQNKEAREGIKSIHTAYLIESENFLKKNDKINAAVKIEKALKIAAGVNLIQKALSINLLLKNENRVVELEEMLKDIKRKEIQSKVQEKINKAEEAEKKTDYKGAIRYFQEAIKIEPQNSTLKKLIDLCVHINRPDLTEKITDWFNKYQHSLLEKEKKQAREELKQSKNNGDESHKDGI